MSGMPKRAMVLAAGLGTRMRPITDTIPKPLVEVGGRTLIDRVLDPLAEAGIERAVVNVHHLADRLEAHLAGRTSPPILISDEREQLLDSGGGVKKALHGLGAEPFFVLNADTFWIDGPRSNLARLAEFWDPGRMDVLMLLSATSAATGYDGPGDYAMDALGRLRRRAAQEVVPFVYAGVMIMKPELFDGTPDGPFSLNRIFDAAQERERLYGLRLDGWWLHVGTPASIGEAERRLFLSTT